MKNTQFLRSFENWKLNESFDNYEFGAAPAEEADANNVVKALIEEVDKAIKLEDYRDANDMLKEFVENNKAALAKANGHQVITALEPWYDTFHGSWEAQEQKFKEEDPLLQADDVEDVEDLDIDFGDLEGQDDAGNLEGPDLEDEW